MDNPASAAPDNDEYSPGSRCNQGVGQQQSKCTMQGSGNKRVHNYDDDSPSKRFCSSGDCLRMSASGGCGIESISNKDVNNQNMNVGKPVLSDSKSARKSPSEVADEIVQKISRESQNKEIHMNSSRIGGGDTPDKHLPPPNIRSEVIVCYGDSSPPPRSALTPAEIDGRLSGTGTCLIPDRNQPVHTDSDSRQELPLDLSKPKRKPPQSSIDHSQHKPNIPPFTGTATVEKYEAYQHKIYGPRVKLERRSERSCVHKTIKDPDCFVTGIVTPSTRPTRHQQSGGVSSHESHDLKVQSSRKYSDGPPPLRHLQNAPRNEKSSGQEDNFLKMMECMMSKAPMTKPYDTYATHPKHVHHVNHLNSPNQVPYYRSNGTKDPKMKQTMVRNEPCVYMKNIKNRKTDGLESSPWMRPEDTPIPVPHLEVNRKIPHVNDMYPLKHLNHTPQYCEMNCLNSTREHGKEMRKSVASKHAGYHPNYQLSQQYNMKTYRLPVRRDHNQGNQFHHPDIAEDKQSDMKSFQNCPMQGGHPQKFAPVLPQQQQSPYQIYRPQFPNTNLHDMAQNRNGAPINGAQPLNPAFMEGMKNGFKLTWNPMTNTYHPNNQPDCAKRVGPDPSQMKIIPVYPQLAPGYMSPNINNDDSIKDACMNSNIRQMFPQTSTKPPVQFPFVPKQEMRCDSTGQNGINGHVKGVKVNGGGWTMQQDMAGNMRQMMYPQWSNNRNGILPCNPHIHGHQQIRYGHDLQR